jgi:hypothetical protein
MNDEEKADKMTFECVVALFYWLTSDRVSHKEAREIIHYNVDRMLDRIEK